MAEVVYPPVILAARASFKALGLRFVTRGTEHVPRAGGAVLASNHVSYLDFIFCGLAAQPSGRLVRFMAKDAVFRNRLAGPLMRGMHHIEVDRSAGASSYRTALKSLKAGEVVGVFPEATISMSYDLKEFKTGAVRMAAAADVPLVPMITWGGQRMMTKGRPRDFSRGCTVALTVGEPLSPTRADDTAAVTAELHDRMGLLLAQTVAAYPDLPSPDAPADQRWWVPQQFGGSAPSPADARAMEKARHDAEE